MIRISNLKINGVSRYEQWLDMLPEPAQAEVLKYVRRIALGNTSSIKSVGAGVYEVRIPRPTKLRVYFGYETQDEMLTLLGGSERGQAKDILEAKRIWHEYKSSKKKTITRRS